MSASERVKNERAKRTQSERRRPNRRFTNILNQQAGSTWSGTDEPTSGRGDNWTDTVGYSVKLGYQVIEEQIRQGQRIAEQVNSGSYGVGAMNNDVQELAQSVQRYCEDSAQLYLRLMGSMTSEMSGRSAGSGNPASGGNSASGIGDLMETFLGNLGKFTSADSYRANGDFHQQQRHNSAHHSPNNTAPGYGAMQLRVSSKKAVDISVNLQSTSDNYEVDRLHEREPSISPLADISLAHSAESGLCVYVTIADDQPDGDYSGIIYDAGTRRHCGTMNVRVGDGPSNNDN